MAKRVLVVAGREGVAPALQLQIELWGSVLDFTLAASGNEALWEVRGSPYDLVLAPWQLPEMNGMEFAEVVQALSPAARVVLIGVPITPAVRSQGKSLGVYALLAETSPQEVAVVVGRALDTPLPRPRPRPAPEPVQVPGVQPEPEKPAIRPISPKAEPRTPPESLAERPAAQPEPAPAPQREEPVPEPEVPAPAPQREQPAPQPTPGPPVKISLSDAQKARIRRSLQDLLVSIGPQVAALLSMSGEVLVTDGSSGNLDLVGLSSRAVATMVGSDDIAEFLGDEHLLGLGLFVGSRYDVYTFTVTDKTVLLLVFDKTILEGKLGSVWLYTRKIVEELQATLG